MFASCVLVRDEGRSPAAPGQQPDKGQTSALAATSGKQANYRRTGIADSHNLPISLENAEVNQVTDIEAKIELILTHERRFAEGLAIKVIKKPELSLWMILLPLLFVYYMNDAQRVKDGRAKFVEQYLIPRQRALTEAAKVVQSGKKPAPETLASSADLHEDTRQKLFELHALLVEHYLDLLQADGSDLKTLHQSAYRNRTNYLLFLNKLGKTEKELDAAIKPHLTEEAARVDEAIKTIEQYGEEIRRAEADFYFPTH